MSVKSNIAPSYPAENLTNDSKRNIRKQKDKIHPALKADYPLYYFPEDKNICFYCDCSLLPHTRTRDHIYPKHLGGKRIRGNAVYSCQPCNILKGSFTILEFQYLLIIKIKTNPPNIEYLQKVLMKVEFMISKLYPNYNGTVHDTPKHIYIQKIFDSEKQIGDLKSGITNVFKRNKHLESENERLKKERQELSVQVSELKKELHNIKQMTKSDRVELIKDGHVDSLSKQLKTNRELVSKLRKDNNDLICQLVQLRDAKPNL